MGQAFISRRGGFDLSSMTKVGQIMNGSAVPTDIDLDNVKFYVASYGDSARTTIGIFTGDGVLVANSCYEKVNLTFSSTALFTNISINRETRVVEASTNNSLYDKYSESMSIMIMM